MNILTRKIYKFILALFVLTMTACGGDSGSDSAEGIEPGPPPSGGNVVIPPVEQPIDGTVHIDQIQSNDLILLTITQLIQTDNTTIEFELFVNGNRVMDVPTSAVTFTLAKLVGNSGSSRGMSWQSYIEKIEDPICRNQADIDNSNNQCKTFTSETEPENIANSARKVQSEFATGKIVTNHAAGENNGTLTDNANGTWRYTYTTSIDTPAADDLVHRACFQIKLNAPTSNHCIDFVPAIAIIAANGITGTSLAEGFYDDNNARKIVSEQSCNTCHDELAMHGGSRKQTDYCVTCHNPGSVDANSGNAVDFKQLIHKLHYGRSLPSKIDDGKPYIIWGFRNSPHDYSKTSYPQQIINCSRCHAGDEDIEFANTQSVPLPKALITLDGHNWVSLPTKQACQSCHEKLFTDNLKINGTQPATNHTPFTDEKDCAGCHRDQGAENPGGIQANQAHRNFANEQGQSLTLNILSVNQTKEGELPKVVFTILNQSGERLHLLDPTQMCVNATFDIRMPSDAAKDYRGRISKSGGISDLVDEGNNEFSVQLSDMVQQGVDTIAATIDFNYPSDCNDSSTEKVRLDSVIAYQASSAEQATARRTVVNVEQCNNCHERFLATDQYHGGTRGVNNPETCIACHGSEFEPSDRTQEFGLLMHGIHGSAIREVPHNDWTTDKLQFPGDIANCSSCHVGDTFTLPLPITREPIKVTSSLYSSAIGAVCSSCHDSAIAKAHMESAGEAMLDVTFEQAEMTVETCSECHGTGKSADVSMVHQK